MASRRAAEEEDGQLLEARMMRVNPDMVEVLEPTELDEEELGLVAAGVFPEYDPNG